MAPGPSRASRPPPGGPPDPRQQHARDEDIAAIFSDMRKASQLSREQLAVRLSTTVRTIEALESGALLALPEWPETSRVIIAYTGMLGLEAGPILRRIQASLHLHAPMHGETEDEPALLAEDVLEPEAMPPLTADRRMTKRPDAPEAGPARVKRRRRVLPWALVLAILVVASGLVVGLYRPHLLRPVIDQIPDSLSRLAGAGLELLRPSGAPDTGETADDPRSRKADKLPQAGAPKR